jgi:hypothetical protein
MCACLALHSQINLPLKFKDNVIKWAELSWMEGQNGKDQRFSIASPPVIDNDTIYLFLNYYQKELENNKNYGYCGYIIKKINRNNGVKYWEIKRKYKEFGNRKILSQPKFKANRIEIPLYDEVKASGYGTDWYECYPAHIVIDKRNGEIIDSNYVDKSNQNLPRLRSFGDYSQFNLTRNPLLVKNEAGYSHFRFWIEELLISKIDTMGNIIRVDSIKYPEFKFGNWDLRFGNTENDSLWLILLSKSQNWSDMQVLFSKYGNDLKLNTTYDVSEHFAFPITAAALYEFDRDYFMVLTVYSDQIAKTEKYTKYLFNQNANFVDSISYTFRPGNDDIAIYAGTFPIADRINNRLLLSQSRQDKLTESTYFELYANDGDTIKTIKRLEVEGIKDHFRTYYSTMLDNGDILLYCEQFTDRSSSGDRWYSWIMLDGQKMNIISGTKDVEKVKYKLKLYPNPTSGILKIDHLELPASIKISDMNGRMIKQINNIVNEVNISDLPIGMYIFDIRNKEISERHKIVKVE